MSANERADSPDATNDATDVPDAAPAKVLSPAAQRALAEAAERRRRADAEAAARPTEIAGRGGLDPVRYGDWEIKGLTSDF
jgi:hypothetical protein